VRPELIEKVLQMARRHGAAIAACRSRDTVKLGSGQDTVVRTLPRSQIWLAQTPQIFKRTLLERAHAKAPGDATDDAQLVERLNRCVKLVESPPENLKVTVPDDLKVAQQILKGKRY
jgi:2-C-methyl-D-erythritol 4-phosphate cytidylyltransferase